jgi:hypothetical protein
MRDVDKNITLKAEGCLVFSFALGFGGAVGRKRGSLAQERQFGAREAGSAAVYCSCCQEQVRQCKAGTAAVYLLYCSNSHCCCKLLHTWCQQQEQCWCVGGVEEVEAVLVCRCCSESSV